VKRSGGRPRLVVTGDGEGIVSHAGSRLVADVADWTGLTAGFVTAMAPDGRARRHQPGRVLVDLAVMLVDGGDCISDLAALREQRPLFGQVASTATAWRALDAVDDAGLDQLRAARASARERAWAVAPPPRQLVVDIDASLVDAASEKEDAAPTFKHGFGFHPLLAWLDRPDAGGGEPLAGILRPGNAGSNTAADHIAVLDLALAQLPAAYRPDPARDWRTDPDAPRLLVRTDCAGATRGFVAALRARGVEYSIGYPVDEPVQEAILRLPAAAWTPALHTDAELREGADVAELTGLLNLSGWPAGSRVIVRRERPHPGAQLRFTDIDGYRFTALLTDTPARGPRAVAGQLAGLELRHRRHARVEDRIKTGKATGLDNLPCRGLAENKAWLELVLTAGDLLAHTRALTLTGPLQAAEPKALRYRLLHTAGRIVTTGRLTLLRLSRRWPWTVDLIEAFTRLRALPDPT
jgi:hypothetical protein